MYVSNFNPAKNDVMTVTLNKNGPSILEEDLAISSSTLGTSDKSSVDEQQNSSNNDIKLGERLVYLNENAMDCYYEESSDTSGKLDYLQEVSSPEMFVSDVEDNLENIDITSNLISTIRNESVLSSGDLCKSTTQEELVARSDYNLLSRINKYLTGVPPPPKHTVCQSDCNDFLVNIKKNAHLFWISPFEDEKDSLLLKSTSPFIKFGKETSSDSSVPHYRTRQASRNLNIAFDACDGSRDSDSRDDSRDLTLVNDQFIESCSTDLMRKNFIAIEKSTSPSTKVLTDRDHFETKLANGNESKSVISNPSKTLLMYSTIKVEKAASLIWPEAYKHKCFGIHYNRNESIEDFENLTTKLCERYLGAETQSTCNTFFTKQSTGSARKKPFLAKRNNGQSPGKRLSYLARRRRTFSSANLQGLADKKQLVLNIRKPSLRKGKSPRGKSPRGKSPRVKTPRGKTPKGKSPRSSTKKRIVRKLTFDGSTPRKVELENSKRALFQSPLGNKAGPSKLTNFSNYQRSQKSLFPTPKKKEDVVESAKTNSCADSKKRKSEDELEGPRYKCAKSLTFDCTQELSENPSSSWIPQRYSTGSLLSRSEHSQCYTKNQLSDIHRKKLLWAVKEALRSKGIGLEHPQFKQYASNLARSVKKLMPDLENKDIPRKSGGTSDRMLKLAKHQLLFITEMKAAN